MESIKKYGAVKITQFMAYLGEIQLLVQTMPQLNAYPHCPTLFYAFIITLLPKAG